MGDIPAVIDAAKTANLLNIGGQLQFRIPNAGTCECYWIEVDTHKEVSTDLPWAERVSATAAVALSQFQRLRAERDFVAEGRTAFGEHLRQFEAQGGDLNEALCFVWYVEGRNQAFNALMVAWEVVAWLIIAIVAMLALTGWSPDLLFRLDVPAELQIARLFVAAILLPPLALRMRKIFRLR